MTCFEQASSVGPTRVPCALTSIHTLARFQEIDVAPSPRQATVTQAEAAGLVLGPLSRIICCNGSTLLCLRRNWNHVFVSRVESPGRVRCYSVRHYFGMPSLLLLCSVALGRLLAQAGWHFSTPRVQDSLSNMPAVSFISLTISSKVWSSFLANSIIQNYPFLSGCLLGFQRGK